MPHPESALVVPVPAAEPVVGPLRSRYDPAAAWGVPAHVTIAYPFVPPDLIDDEVTDRIRRVIAASAAFEADFDRVDQFGAAVLFLKPSPSERFTALTHAVLAEWPEYPPYEGAHEEVIPHLTVAHTGRGASFDAIRARLHSELPIRTRVETVDLMIGCSEPGSWRTVAAFDLG